MAHWSHVLKHVKTTRFERRPTRTNFQSHHPLAHQMAVVSTSFTKASSICSSVADRLAEEENIMAALQWNQYLPSLITKHSEHHQWRHPIVIDQPKATITLLYIRNISDSIKWILTPLSIKVRFQPLTTLRGILFQPKDTVPIEEWAGVVYLVPCAACDQCFIGQTGRTLFYHIKEHKTAMLSYDSTSSALAEHCINTEHSIHLNSALIIDTNKDWHLWCSLESWHMRTNTNTLNRNSSLLL